MINCFVKPTVWKQTKKLGTCSVLSLACCFIAVFTGLLVPSISYGDDHIVDKDDEVILISSILNVRSKAEISTPYSANVKGSVSYGTEGIILSGPVVGVKYTWYEVQWETEDNLRGWSAYIINGCKTMITTERAEKKDRLVDELFGLDPDQTNHDYNDYGCRPHNYPNTLDGYYGGHAGWDVQTKAEYDPRRNHMFYSLTSGIVIRADEGDAQNNSVIAVYNADDEKTTLYLHASSVYVSVDSEVEVRSLLGKQGDTGNATGPHVHIEVREGKTPNPSPGIAGSGRSGHLNVDPVPYLFEAINFHPNQRVRIVGFKRSSDVNRDARVDLLDLLLVWKNIGELRKDTEQYDLNDDGVIDKLDVVEVAKNLDDSADTSAAPAVNVQTPNVRVSHQMVQQWLNIMHEVDDGSFAFKRAIVRIEKLLTRVIPERTVLLPNYPNPFNPETWIPYQLAASADVRVSIYSADGKLVRTLVLGHQPMGNYQGKNRAAYWDGRNALGEPVASGVYFYTLTAGEFKSTRKMLVRK